MSALFLIRRSTERLSLYSQGSWLQIDGVRHQVALWVREFREPLKYLTVNDRDREFLTLGVNRKSSGTGTNRIGASKGATEPRLYFGKGLGDLDIGYLRPLAVPGFIGYLSADARPRPDLIRAGFAVQYSIPYLLSKVQSFDLRPPVRGLTPMTEILFTIPVGRSYGARTIALIAPGTSYAGEGWEFLIEALVPATRATGTGAGVRAQLNLALEYLFPSTIGRPLFAPP